MRAKVVTETEQELTDPPFCPNYTVVAVNATGTAETLQSADTQMGTFANIATVQPGEAVEVVLDKPWVRLADAGALILLAH